MISRIDQIPVGAHTSNRRDNRCQGPEILLARLVYFDLSSSSGLYGEFWNRQPSYHIHRPFDLRQSLQRSKLFRLPRR